HFPFRPPCPTRLRGRRAHQELYWPRNNHHRLPLAVDEPLRLARALGQRLPDLPVPLFPPRPILPPPFPHLPDFGLLAPPQQQPLRRTVQPGVGVVTVQIDHLRHERLPLP